MKRNQTASPGLDGLTQQVKSSEGLIQRVILGRQDKIQNQLLTEALAFATEVADLEDKMRMRGSDNI